MPCSRWDRAGLFVTAFVFPLIVLNQVRHFGTRWAFGPSGLPRHKLAPDGWH